MLCLPFCLFSYFVTCLIMHHSNKFYDFMKYKHTESSFQNNIEVRLNIMVCIFCIVIYVYGRLSRKGNHALWSKPVKFCSLCQKASEATLENICLGYAFSEQERRTYLATELLHIILLLFRTLQNVRRFIRSPCFTYIQTS